MKLENILTALATVESTLNDNAIGLAGERSRYQIREAVWHHHMPKIDFITGSSDQELSTVCAKLELTLLSKQFASLNKRNLTLQDIYAMWNLGFEGYKKRNFNLNECPALTQRTAGKFALLVQRL